MNFQRTSISKLIRYLDLLEYVTKWEICVLHTNLQITRDLSMYYINRDKFYHMVSMAIPEIKEVVIIQKCNSIDIVFTTKTGDIHKAINKVMSLWNILSQSGHIKRRDINIYFGYDAVRHVLKTTASLKSIVIGDDQVFSQVRRAWIYATINKKTGPILTLLYCYINKIGKYSYTKTTIHKGRVSVAKIAIELVQRKVGYSYMKESIYIVLGSTWFTKVTCDFLLNALKVPADNIIVIKNPNIKISSLCELFNKTTSKNSKYRAFFIIVCDSKFITDDILLIVNSLHCYESCEKKYLMDLTMPSKINTTKLKALFSSIITIEDVLYERQQRINSRKNEIKNIEKTINELVYSFYVKTKHLPLRIIMAILANLLLMLIPNKNFVKNIMTIISSTLALLKKYLHIV